jgi:hypothetical protein
MLALAVSGIAVILVPEESLAAQETAGESVDKPIGESFTAVPDVTVWPNLTRLPDGVILLAGFDKPSHGQVEGDVACWASEDEGQTWTLRGTVTAHDPNTVRMNHAVGLDADGNLVALVGGWTDLQQPNAQKRGSFRDAIIRPWVCRSADGGKTWTKHEDFPTDPDGREFVAFGDIVVSTGGRLNTSAYSTSYYAKPGPWAAFFLVSEDNGQTWQIRSKIADDLSETALLNVGNGEWLAALRGSGLMLFRSTDDGLTWQDEGRVSEDKQIPGHLLQLRDGRVLLTYGDRRSGQRGVRARISSDKGKSWGDPVYVASMPESDGGYPASLEREDGQILTMYYAKPEGAYSVQAVIWDVNLCPAASTNGG